MFALGALLLTAGALLFVAAHWDGLSPAGRFAIVLAAIAALHAGGAFASRSSPALAATLHAVGTGAFGAGIYLAGQVFHMAEHWPAALLLWAAGAAVAVYLLRRVAAGALARGARAGLALGRMDGGACAARWAGAT